MAGLLTFPFGIPSQTSVQWITIPNRKWDLQQRELFQIFTGFPFKARLNTGYHSVNITVAPITG